MKNILYIRSGNGQEIPEERRKMLFSRKKTRIITGLLLGGLLVTGWYFLLPAPLFKVPYSTVLLDREGKVIGTTVADDQQFRFPAPDRLPAKYLLALITFEDKNFFQHRGVDWLALGRAFWQNIKARRIVSGGSTISMQLIRISRRNPPRTYLEKLWEILLTLRMEQTTSKYEILKLYATHAPCGGNIVGLQAASFKYFHRRPEQLSWAEAAFLAVLPNAPSLSNPAFLEKKRNRLLEKLWKKGWIKEKEDYELALAEPLPERIYNAPCEVPHLLSEAFLNRKGQMVQSTIDSRLQKRVNEIVARHSGMLSHNLIYNAAVLVAHIPSGEVRAYVGNSPFMEGSRGNQVNIIHSRRSSGSVLKPALYALMQQNGYILPATLIPDIPSRFGKYAPANFNRFFYGAVPADKALAMSLNIPFVRLLKEYSYIRFWEELQQLGIHSLDQPADHYGLSLILGGAETSLWDLCNMYAGMVSVLRHYDAEDGQYYQGEYERLKIWEGEKKQEKCKAHEAPLKASAIWLTLEALRNLERPEMESGWKNFASRLDLAWKTGTSFGFRDAWAIGVNADWVVGVWVGNADGEGRPGLTGVKAAAPLLFEVAGLLPVTEHWIKPAEEMQKVVVCRKSGYRASEICEERDTVEVCEKGIHMAICPYHHWINLDATGQWRVNSNCESVYDMKVTPWFVLPPVQEWYYVRTHSDYQSLPPYKPGCEVLTEDVMEMIYPQQGIRVFLPRDFGGEKGSVVFELAHRDPAAEVYWHMDGEYIGTSVRFHQMEVRVKEGRHVLTLVDNNGNMLRRVFRAVGKEEEVKF